MILSFAGLLGSGKTLGMTASGYLDKLFGNYQIYSNYKTTFSTLIDPLELFHYDLDNCVILLDELETLFDSRNSSSTANRLLSYFFLQSRKKKVKIKYTAQMMNTVDLRAKYITNYIALSEAVNRDTDNNPEYFRYTIYYGSNPNPIKRIIFPYHRAKAIFELYDTTEIILPFVLNPDAIEVDNLLSDFTASPTKKSFVVLTKRKYPFLSIDSISASYDFLRVDDTDRAVKCLVG